MRLSLLALGVLVASVLSVPSTDYVPHEKRHRLPRGWKRTNRAPSRQLLPIRIALAQGNLDKGHEYLMDVSHPESPNFGKHWSAKSIAEAFAPSSESVNAVTEWLQTSGISSERISKSQSLGWLQFDATVIEAEDLLKTKFYTHHHETGKPFIACDEYHLPKHLGSHVDFVTPTVHFDTKIPQAVLRRDKPSLVAEVGTPVKTHAAVKIITDPKSPSHPKKGEDVDIKDVYSDLGNCNTFITPDCLRALYRFPRGSTANPKNSYGIVEYTPQSFLQGDLDLFFSNFSTHQVQKTPTTELIDGAVVQSANTSFGINGESDLDLEYAMALVNPQKVTLYQVGDLVVGASFNNFLDAIDGSYCSYEGGDDPLQDSIYPDPSGYKGPENCGGFAATKVISTSYSYNEADLTAKYEMRQCHEYMKLGLQGTSVVYSSGDYGVAGNQGECIGPGGNLTGPASTSGKFNPSFPGSCPYVTAVGATQVKPNATVTQPEEACETVIYSGGGFSNVFPLPDYQRHAVKHFFAEHPPPYTSAQYNNSQCTRGFPDISANGANYLVAVDGVFSTVYGTSASAPTVGAILTLINEARFNAGKGSIGFVNPTLYAHPHLLNDITSGGNQGCGTPGFTATKGWDPVTGLGTPNFPRLLEKFLHLP